MNFLCCPSEPRQKKSAEQMENSTPNPSFSICDIQIQKQISRNFGKSFPPQKIVLPKLRPHCSATLPEYLEGRTPKEKHPFLFQKKSVARKSEMQGVFFLSGLPRLCEAVAERYERTRQFQATTHAERATSFVLKIGASLVQ